MASAATRSYRFEKLTLLRKKPRRLSAGQVQGSSSVRGIEEPHTSTFLQKD
jgi:hypothetical protein